jgi:hypothetical protein
MEGFPAMLWRLASPLAAISRRSDKWGANKAVERYGSLKVPQGMNNPPHDCYPQFKQDQRLNKHYDAPNNWVRGANETAENKPGYVPGYKGKR